MDACGGTVRDVADDNMGLRVVIHVPEPSRTGEKRPGYAIGLQAYARFDGKWREQVLRLPPGAGIAVIGSIARFDALMGGSLTLEHCEIVAAQNRPPAADTSPNPTA